MLTFYLPLHRYYFFLIYLSLILYSIIGVSFGVLFKLSNDLQSIPRLIANKLPGVSDVKVYNIGPVFILYSI